MYFTKQVLVFLSIVHFLFLNVSWSQTPPKIIATGNQAYCPLSEMRIVTDFDISNPDNTEINVIHIQISTGYETGDSLDLIGSHPKITKSIFNTQEGKLTLTAQNSGITGINDLIAAAKDVVFKSNSAIISGEKYFSFTLGDANYLPITGHFYEYVPDLGITWTDAKIAAEDRVNVYGLQGYLATITYQEEAALTGEQASGAGWIGGSDAAIEDVWKWVTGPEKGMVFWNGLANGSSPPGVFSNWNSNEPNNLGDEDYAHVTAPGIGIDGSWNDLSNTGATSGDYQPKGYIVEYGGMPDDPVVDLSGFSRIYVPTISTTSENRCGPGTITLSATASEGTVLWFDAPSGGTQVGTGPTFPTPVLSTTKSYYAFASVNGCTSGTRSQVIATIFQMPSIKTAIDFKNCDVDEAPDGFTNFNLDEINDVITYNNSELNVTYHLTHTAANSPNSIPLNPLIFNNGDTIVANTVYARVENEFGCYQVSTITLQVSTTSFTPGYMQHLEFCDDDDTADGLRLFDLTQTSTNILNDLPAQNLIVHYYRDRTDAQLEQNEILPQNAYLSETPFSQTLFVRVENEDNGDCYGIGDFLTLTVRPRPEFELLPTAIVCLNLSPITLETYNPQGNFDYEWTDENGIIISNESTAVISKGGTYTVIATSNLNCKSFPFNVIVTESIEPDIGLDDISIKDDSANNSITINNENNNLGIGDYEFSLDDSFGPYQEEPFFEMVASGVHTIYVRDKNACGNTSIDVSVIGYPKFFSPNNDGINDTWQIKGVNEDFYPTSLIYIFNRYGKILAQIDPIGLGWNGILNGQLLPATDYWFRVQLIDENGTIREKMGHFSLVR